MKYLLIVMSMIFASATMASPNISHHNNSFKGEVKSNIHNSNKNSNANKNANYNKASNYSSNKASANNYNHSSTNSDSKSKASSKSGAYNGGNSVNVSDDSYSVYKEVRQAPMVVPGSGNNTAQCIKVIGLGGSYAAGNAGGFSLGWPKTDWECSLDRAAKMAFSLGNVTTGWKLFCSQRTTVKAYRILDKKLNKVGAIKACLHDSK